jgi:hypothetical protein
LANYIEEVLLDPQFIFIFRQPAYIFSKIAFLVVLSKLHTSSRYGKQKISADVSRRFVGASADEYLDDAVCRN